MLIPNDKNFYNFLLKKNEIIYLPDNSDFQIYKIYKYNTRLVKSKPKRAGVLI